MSENRSIQSFSDFYKSLTSVTHEDAQKTGLMSFSTTQANFDAKRKHLLDLYSGVTVSHSFLDDAGQIFDCVPISQQPALKRSGRPLASPPNLPGEKVLAASGTKVLDTEQKDQLGNLRTCPPGTVPIRRVTLEEMGRFDGVDEFLKKRPSGKKVEGMGFAPAAEPTHEWAHAEQDVANVGGHSILNVWSPTVSGDEIFSLSQQWITAGGGNALQTLEAGWQVYPQKYGHAHPVLFTYWTADDYGQTGSYNGDAGAFVQYSPTCPVGAALSQTSISGGNQAEVELSWLLANGNWWLFINGTDMAHAVGYYPASQYGGGALATGATSIDFGGETVGSTKFPPMGSGAFASTGYRKAAYQRNITYFPPAGGVQDAQLAGVQDWPSAYTVAVQKTAEWGAFIFFGGPGSVSAVIAQAPIKRQSQSFFTDLLGTKQSSTLWASMTALFVLALVGCGTWVGNSALHLETGALHTQLLFVDAVLLVLCVLAGLMVNGRPAGILIDEENRISLTRVQWVAWLIVLLGGFFVESIWNVAVAWDGGAKGPFPLMQPELYALLGIVSGSAVVSGVIANGKTNAPNAPIPPAAPAIGTPTNNGLLDANVSSSEASWADLYLGDEVATRNVVDVSRLQKLIITVLLVMTYIRLLWNDLAALPTDATGKILAKAHFATMPQVGESFLWLLGISHAAYLAYKAMPKPPVSSPTPTPTPPPYTTAR